MMCRRDGAVSRNLNLKSCLKFKKLISLIQLSNNNLQSSIEFNCYKTLNKFKFNK